LSAESEEIPLGELKSAKVPYPSADPAELPAMVATSREYEFKVKF
jgi:hypothetical protein